MSGKNIRSSAKISSFQYFDPGSFIVKAIRNHPTLQPSTKHQYIKAIEQVSKLLGHTSFETTQDYLNIELDLEMTISDFVPF